MAGVAQYPPSSHPVVDAQTGDRITRPWLGFFQNLVQVLSQTAGTVFGPGVSVDNEIALWSGTTGDTLKRATGSGVVRAASGVYSSAELSGDVTTTGSNVATIANNAVSNAKLRDSGALSVIGRSANSSGDPADISAMAASDAVLRESGSTVAFGTVATAGIAANAVTYPKLQDVSAASKLLGRGSAAGAGDPEEITLGGGLTMSTTTLDTTLTLAASTYTPTLTNVTNLDGSTPYSCQYLRVGSVVTVSGRVDVDPTAAGTTKLGISLPVASNLANANECAGTAAASGIAGQAAAIEADATNDRAQMEWIAVDVTNQPMYFTMTYRII